MRKWLVELHPQADFEHLWSKISDLGGRIDERQLSLEGSQIFRADGPDDLEVTLRNDEHVKGVWPDVDDDLKPAGVV